MLTLFAKGGSLAALAAALAVAVPAAPAAAQEPPHQSEAFEPAQMGIAPPERRGRAMRVHAETMAEPRASRPEPAFAPPQVERPRFERSDPPPAAYMPPQRIDVPASRPAPRGGFGSGMIERARADAAAVGADRPDRRGGWGRRGPDQPVAQDGPVRNDVRGPGQGGWRGDRAGGRPGGWRGDRQPGWQGNPQPAPQPDIAQPSLPRGGWQGERRDGAGNVRGDGDRGGWRNGDRNRWRGDQVLGRTIPPADGAGDVAGPGRRGDWNRDGRGDWNRDRRGDWNRDGRGDWDRDRRGDWNRDGRGDWRDGRWGDGRRGDWNRDRRDGWRDGWRGDRRNWRRDDWRWGWNGRPGWDNRNFSRWNRGWRGNRSYDWFDFRRGNQFLFRPGPYYAPFRSHRYSRVDIGFFLDSLFFQPRFFINDPWAYHLPPAYGPYQWVRYYDDVVLVDIYTGEVVDVVHNFFW